MSNLWSGAPRPLISNATFTLLKRKLIARIIKDTKRTAIMTAKNENKVWRDKRNLLMLVKGEFILFTTWLAFLYLP